MTAIAKATKYGKASLPHLQRANRSHWRFHLLAYREMFRRDIKRIPNCYEGTTLCRGFGALAGTTYNTDRDYLAEQLGFSKVCLNAMDAVSDRDFALEFLSCSSIAMMHLSRFCEELILWSSSEFRFIEMDDAFSTGSSIMPQKKNPDMAELIRGKTGRVYGDLMTLLTIMKGLPLAYNKDMQEDKQPVFDAGDTLKSSLAIFIQMIDTMKINTEVMENAAKSGFMNATDAADYLVSKGLAFRDCHEIIGRSCFIVLKRIGDRRTDAGGAARLFRQVRGRHPSEDRHSGLHQRQKIKGLHVLRERRADAERIKRLPWDVPSETGPTLNASHKAGAAEYGFLREHPWHGAF